MCLRLEAGCEKWGRGSFRLLNYVDHVFATTLFIHKMCWGSIVLCRQQKKAQQLVEDEMFFHTEDSSFFSLTPGLSLGAPHKDFWCLSFCPVTTRSQTWWFDKDGQGKRNVKFHDVVARVKVLISLVCFGLPISRRDGNRRIPILLENVLRETGLMRTDRWLRETGHIYSKCACGSHGEDCSCSYFSLFGLVCLVVNVRALCREMHSSFSSSFLAIKGEKVICRNNIRRVMIWSPVPPVKLLPCGSTTVDRMRQMDVVCWQPSLSSHSSFNIHDMTCKDNKNNQETKELFTYSFHVNWKKNEKKLLLVVFFPGWIIYKPGLHPTCLFHVRFETIRHVPFRWPVFR